MGTQQCFENSPLMMRSKTGNGKCLAFFWKRSQIMQNIHNLYFLDACETTNMVLKRQHDSVTCLINGGDAQACTSNMKVHRKVQTGQCWTASVPSSSRGLGPDSLCACGWCACAAAV